MGSGVNYENLATIPAFKGFTGAQIAALTAIATKRQASPGQVIIQEGDLADSFYLLCSGGLEVYVEQGDKPLPLAQLGPGQLIGEMPLVYKQPIRQASVKTVAPSSLLRFHYRDYENLVAQHPEIGEIFLQNLGRIVETRTGPLNEAPLLTECLIFQGLPGEYIQLIADIAKTKDVEANTPIVRMDEPADCFYLITHGQVEVLLEKDGVQHPLTRLGRGQVFGEMTLIYQQPMRFASVASVIPTKLMVFAFSDFHKLMEQHFELGQRISENLAALAASRSWVLEQ